jgi:hypothetical protein
LSSQIANGWPLNPKYLNLSISKLWASLVVNDKKIFCNHKILNPVAVGRNPSQHKKLTFQETAKTIENP